MRFAQLLAKVKCRWYTPAGYTDSVDPNGCVIEGSWRQEAMHALQPLVHTGQRNHTVAASQTRDRFADYFSSQEGELSWQVDYVQRTR